MRGITTKQREILVHLQCSFCSASELAAFTSQPRRAIYQHIQALEKKGLVTSRNERRDDGVIRRVARITADGIIALEVQP